MDRILSLPYRQKLILVFTFLILFSITILGSITYVQFSRTMEKQTKEYTLQISDQIKQNLERYVMEMQIISLSPLFDQEVLQILRNHREENTDGYFPVFSERTKMWRYISSLLYLRTEIKGIHVFTNDGQVFSNMDSNSIKLQMDEMNQDWTRQVKQADGAWVLLPYHKPDYYLKPFQEGVFSIARLIRDPYTYETLGIIKIDIREALIEQIIGKVSLTNQSRVFIMDQNNQLVYPGGRQDDFVQNIMALLNEDSIDIDKESYVRIDNESYMVIEEDSESSGLKIIAVIPKQEILKEVNQLRFTIFIFAFISLIFGTILAIFLSKPLVGSILRLKSAMQRVEEGNLSEQVQVQSIDEIGQLGEGFNRMIQEINHLVKEVYEISLREKDAELRALQSQINPHFLYNTLESINMMALSNKQLAISDMVSSLGKLMRYTVDSKGSMVALKEELDFVGSYIKIQQIRLGDRIAYELDMDPRLYSVKIPKLILQPIVENAILHGLKSPSGLIRITVREEANNAQESLKIIIADNGCGMEPAQLEAIRQSLYQPFQQSRKSGGMALPNVAQRIQLLYGDDFGLEIDGKKDHGVAVTLRFPIHTQEDDGNVERTAG